MICSTGTAPAPAPNRVRVTDFTYVRTWAGFVYVAFIVDVYAQRIVAWHASMTKVTDLVMAPLRMALWQRDHEGHPVEASELIHHSDAGSQYTSIRFTEHLEIERIQPSIGSVGDAYDNALMETIHGLYKTECIRTTVFHPGAFKTLAGRRVRDSRLGRLVQQPQAPQHARDDHPSRARNRLLRGPQPRATTRIAAAEKLGRFRSLPAMIRKRQG